jgi:hypothetical protein
MDFYIDLAEIICNSLGKQKQKFSEPETYGETNQLHT